MTASSVVVMSRERLMSAVRAACLIRPCSTACQTTMRHQTASSNPYTGCVRLVMVSTMPEDEGRGQFTDAFSWAVHRLFAAKHRDSDSILLPGMPSAPFPPGHVRSRRGWLV